MLQRSMRQDAERRVQSSPIVGLARRLELLHQESEEMDDLDPGSEVAALEEEVARNPATDLTDAAVQVMLAAAHIERLREGLVADTEAALHRMERLLRSALSAVLRETGINLAALGGERYTPSYTDPIHRAARYH